MTRLKSWGKSLIIYLLIFLFVSFIGNIWLTRNQAKGPAPAIVGQGLDGKIRTVDLKQFDSPVLLYFFADWCPICKLQHSVIASISQHYPVIGVAMQSGTVENVQRYANEQGLKFPIVNDKNGVISRSFGVDGVPATFVVDPVGQLRYSTRGYATELGLMSRILISKATVD